MVVLLDPCANLLLMFSAHIQYVLRKWFQCNSEADHFPKVCSIQSWASANVQLSPKALPYYKAVWNLHEWHSKSPTRGFNSGHNIVSAISYTDSSWFNYAWLVSRVPKSSRLKVQLPLPIESINWACLISTTDLIHDRLKQRDSTAIDFVAVEHALRIYKRMRTVGKG